MKKLYIIRHAESEANSRRILASRLPFPLTRAGKEDADRIAAELTDLAKIDRIISSPLVRAKETATSFAEAYGLPVEQDVRLAEQELGIYSGMTYDEVKTEDRYESNTLNRWDWIPEGGESYAMIASRVKSFFLSLEEDEKEEAILIVTHAVVFRLIRAVLEQTLPVYPSKFPNNGEIWKVKFTSTDERHTIESLFLGNSRDFIHNP